MKEPPPVTGAKLDVNAYESDPCLIIKFKWLEDFGLDARGGVPKTDANGTACAWPAVEGGREISVGVVLRGREGGLSKVYLNESTYREFEPGAVAGYPSVVATSKEWPASACTTHVGTADRAGFEAHVNVHDPKAGEERNPCTISNEVAAAVVDRLKMPR